MTAGNVLALSIVAGCWLALAAMFILYMIVWRK